MLYGNLSRRGAWERMDTCACMFEFLFCSLETIAILLIGFTPIKNKKFKKRRTSNYNLYTISNVDIHCRRM